MASLGDPIGLIIDANTADINYDLPFGTMESILSTESNYGQNVGTNGTAYQISGSTRSNPGYGLSPLDGNSANDAASYLSVFGGSLADKFAAYHGGAGNPTPYASGTPADQFLQSGITGSPNGSTSASGHPDGLMSPGSALDDALKSLTGGFIDPAKAAKMRADFQNQPGTWESWAIRAAFGIMGMIFLTIGLAALALKSSPQRIVTQAIKNAGTS